MEVLPAVDSSIALRLPAVRSREVVVQFDGGDLSSDAGLLLVKQADMRVGLTSALASSITDRRQPGKCRHTMEKLIQERVYAIAQGYPDANDLDNLRHDPALKVACNERPRSTGVLASQPTMSRIENSVRRADVLRAAIALAERVVGQLPSDTRHVVLDIDATPDPCHGQQELEFFNGHYGCHCYLPLHLYVTGEDGVQRLMASVLRSGNASYRDGLFGTLARAVRILRARFAGLRVTLRADAGFGFHDVLAFCEANDLGYVIGLASNERLATLSGSVQLQAALRHWLQNDRDPEYTEVQYKAGTWLCKRRVVVKVEVAEDPRHPHRKKVNARYVVTNLRSKPKRVYGYYCKRGDRENRIKETKIDCFSGRTSCHRFLANQFRLLLYSASHVLMQTLQEALRGTQWARAQVSTLRVVLLKVAVRVVESCRRLVFHLPSSFPYKKDWLHLTTALAMPAT